MALARDNHTRPTGIVSSNSSSKTTTTIQIYVKRKPAATERVELCAANVNNNDGATLPVIVLTLVVNSSQRAALTIPTRTVARCLFAVGLY